MAKKIQFINYDKYYEEKNIITVADGFKKNEFDPKGIYSEEIFGNYYEDNNDITQRGWISLNHKLINPILFLMMKNKKIINTEDLEDIMGIVDRLDKDPNEFLDSRRNAKSNETIDFLIKNQKHLLISKYPVFSHKLRPITVIGGAKPTLIYDKVNNHFSMLIEYNNTIEDSLSGKNFDNNNFVLGMQELINTITQFLMSSVLSKKQGVLRKEVLGVRCNFSCRAVITPLVGDYDIDDISIPYIVAVELYKYQIINMLVRIKNINYNRALRIHEFAQLKFNPEVYSILINLMKNTKGGLKIVVNRNPTISVGSIMLMNVAHIKSDIDDMTISISNNTLSPFAGDYDGDVLNFIAIHDNLIKESLEMLSPRNLIINKEGVIDRRFSFIKEQNLGIWQINNI